MKTHTTDEDKHLAIAIIERSKYHPWLHGFTLRFRNNQKRRETILFTSFIHKLRKQHSYNGLVRDLALAGAPLIRPRSMTWSNWSLTLESWITPEGIDEMIRKRKHNPVEAALRKALDYPTLLELFKKEPQYFDIAALAAEDRALLLRSNFSRFEESCNPSKLPVHLKADLFVSHQKKMMKHIDFNKMTKSAMFTIASRKPSFFKKFDLPLNKVDEYGWHHLLKFDFAYFAPLCLENISNISNASGVRNLMKQRPELMNMITIDQMRASKLNAKQWILFVGSKEFIRIVRPRKVTLSLLPETKDWLEQEAMVEVLSGTEKSTKRLKAALMEMKK
jgi:hypothetical protein